MDVAALFFKGDRASRLSALCLGLQGFSVKQQLHLICLHTDDKELRELMVSLVCHGVSWYFTLKHALCLFL